MSAPQSWHHQSCLSYLLLGCWAIVQAVAQLLQPPPLVYLREGSSSPSPPLPVLRGELLPKAMVIMTILLQAFTAASGAAAKHGNPAVARNGESWSWRCQVIE